MQLLMLAHSQVPHIGGGDECAKKESFSPDEKMAFDQVLFRVQ